MINTIPVCIFYSSIIFDNKPMIIIIIKLLFLCLCSKVTVYSRKLQWFFWDLSLTLPCEFRVHRAGSQLKMSECQDKSWEPDLTITVSHSLTLSLSHSLTLSLSHSLILSFTLSRHAEQLLFSCLCSKVAVYR